MITQAAIATFDQLPLDCGITLSPVDVAYETYGELNTAKDNAILTAHAFSGDAHAAGEGGWWSNMIGPGKAFDTDRYFVICSNILGGCRGTTGPGSINPATGCPWAMSFPAVSVSDMVRLQKMLIDRLGISRLLAVAGGSMGGMQALEWAVAYPDSVASALPIACTARHSAQQIAFNEVGRQAIMADPDWNGGDYYQGRPPARGLSVARMVGHITYMSDESMREKFGRRLNAKDQFEVEGYLQYRGSKFVDRFDANSYIYITRAMDTFDLTDRGTLASLFERGQNAVSGDQLHVGLALSQLPIARNRKRVAQPQLRRCLSQSGVALRPRCLPARIGRADRLGPRLPCEHACLSFTAAATTPLSAS